MPCPLYAVFCMHVLGIPQGSSFAHQSAQQFQNMLLQDIDMLQQYYYKVDYYSRFANTLPSKYSEPVLLPGDRSDMARILARFTLFLIGTDAITPRILNSVWGADNEAKIALGRPRGDLSLIRWHVLTLSKFAINTIHMWMTDPDTPILADTLPTFQKLPPTFKQLLLHTKEKVVYAREPVPSGRELTKLFSDNLRAHL
jgi:hypothetical protein